MAPQQMDAEQRLAEFMARRVALAEREIRLEINALETYGIRVTGVDVNDDGSVVILWQPEVAWKGDDDGTD